MLLPGNDGGEGVCSSPPDKEGSGSGAGGFSMGSGCWTFTVTETGLYLLVGGTKTTQRQPAAKTNQNTIFSFFLKGDFFIDVPGGIISILYPIRRQENYAPFNR